MKHPKQYHTVPFNGYNVMVVNSGTEIAFGITEKKEVITDDNAVFKGTVMYCTQTVYDSLIHSSA